MCGSSGYQSNGQLAFEGDNSLRREFEQLKKQRNKLSSKLRKSRQRAKRLHLIPAVECSGDAAADPKPLCPRRANGVALNPRMIMSCKVHMQSSTCVATERLSKLTCAPYTIQGPNAGIDYHFTSGSVSKSRY